jgi:hypothetical protein
MLKLAYSSTRSENSLISEKQITSQLLWTVAQNCLKANTAFGRRRCTLYLSAVPATNLECIGASSTLSSIIPELKRDVNTSTMRYTWCAKIHTIPRIRDNDTKSDHQRSSPLGIPRIRSPSIRGEPYINIRSKITRERSPRGRISHHFHIRELLVEGLLYL